MVQITKAEAEYLRSMGIKEGITRTMKQKSKRGRKQLCCEDKYILELLNEYRNSQNVIETYGDIKS